MSLENLRKIDFADLDNDGDLDILSMNTRYKYVDKSRVVWYKNLDGLGTFSKQIIIYDKKDLGDPSYFTVADIDGDSDNDVIVIFHSGVSIFRNIDGKGEFEIKPKSSTNNTFASKKIFTADVDGDADLDIIIKNNGATAWYENVDGFQTDPNNGQLLEGHAIKFLDIDGDGDLDILYLDGKLVWKKNLDGKGDFGYSHPVSHTSEIISFDAGDLDSDGDLDIVASTSNNLTFIFENTNGYGIFEEANKFSGINIDPSNTTPASVVLNLTTHIANFDGNSYPDILLSSNASNKIVLYKNFGKLKNKLIGDVYFDTNSNGCDSLDFPLKNLIVSTDNGFHSFGSSTLYDGSFQIPVNIGKFNTILNNIDDRFLINPVEQTSEFSEIGQIDTIHFCLTSSEIIKDLSAKLLPTENARPGFRTAYSLILENNGTVPLSGKAFFNYDSKYIKNIHSDSTINYQTEQSIGFDFKNLMPTEIRSIPIKVTIKRPPTVNVDDELILFGSIETSSDELTKSNNIDTLEQIVIGSFDPNDISVIEGKKILLTEKENFLHYIIRFQNTGTSHAIKVKVTNTLDENLDWNTFQLIGSSHEYKIEITDSKEISFHFDNIYLPDSTINEIGSHGHIAYKIKPKENIQLGQVISNKAEIFFDYNEAVVTNTVQTEIVDKITNIENNFTDFLIYPNPINDILVINSQIQIIKIEIYNNLAQMILSNKNQNRISLSNLKAGIYYCKVENIFGQKGVKKITKN